MAEVIIRDRLWRDFSAVARRRRQRAAALAEEVLHDFVKRMADEELLARSEEAARRAPFDIADSEKIVRQARRKRR